MLALSTWLERYSRPCFYKKHFGFECPGCGFQRALLELINGNVWQSIKLYPALLPLLLMMVVLLLHLKFQFKNGAYIILVLFVLSVVLIVGNYLYKVVIT